MDWFESATKMVVLLTMLVGLSVVVRVAIKGGWRRPGVPDPVRPGEVDELRRAVERLTGEVAELQERVDFAERMLTQQRERPGLPEPR